MTWSKKYAITLMEKSHTLVADEEIENIALMIAYLVDPLYLKKNMAAMKDP